MIIYDALRKDHDEVKALLAELVQMTDEKSSRREELISEIRDALIPHARAEETVFYNSLRALEPAKGLVGHAYQEHMEAEALLRTLQVADKIDAGWLKTAQTLKSALEHHIQEEEGQIFSAAKQVFTAEEAEMMGEAFEKLKPEIKSEGMMATTAELVANLIPPRLAQAFSKFNLESRIGR